MKLLIAIGVSVLLLFSVPAGAQVVKGEKEERYVQQWNRLMPRQVKLQFAGSMGMFSLGTGWFYGRNAQWETDVFIGFIPSIDDIKGHITMTLKQTYTPFHLKLNDAISFEPLTGGAYINKIFGSYFWNRLPDKYPQNYYFWATNTRFNVFVGQAFTLKSGDPSNESNWSFYYEVNTNDLYVISAIGNRVIKLNDIVNLSIGLRYRIF